MLSLSLIIRFVTRPGPHRPQLLVMLMVAVFAQAKSEIFRPSKNVKDVFLLQLQSVGLSSDGRPTLIEGEINCLTTVLKLLVRSLEWLFLYLWYLILKKGSSGCLRSMISRRA